MSPTENQLGALENPTQHYRCNENICIGWLLSHSGVSPRDLDAFVKFEFQYPSAVSVCPGSSVPQSVTLATVLTFEGFKKEV